MAALDSTDLDPWSWTHTTKLLVHAIDFGYSKVIAVNRVRLHRDIVVECCRVLGKDVVAKQIWRCFQLACQQLRALDATEEYADCIANVAVQDHSQIPVWMHAVACKRKKPQIICALDLHLPPFS